MIKPEDLGAGSRAKSSEEMEVKIGIWVVSWSVLWSVLFFAAII